jgi:hypothetical protein
MNAPFIFGPFGLLAALVHQWSRAPGTTSGHGGGAASVAPENNCMMKLSNRETS